MKTLYNSQNKRLLKAPKVCITMRALRKLQLYIRACRVEVGGLGIVEASSPEELLVKDVFTLKQKATFASTHLDPDALAQLITTKVEQGEDPAAIRCWWHSHADMDVFFSSTDEQTIAQFTGDFLIAIVGNRSGDLLCRLDLFRPLQLSMIVPLVCPEEEELLTQVESDVEQDVCTPALREPFFTSTCRSERYERRLLTRRREF
jgi:hypothetical protein